MNSIKNILFTAISVFSLTATAQQKSNITVNRSAPYLMILGTIQDAGSPHIACNKSCCSALFENPDNTRKVVSLGLIDPADNKTFIFEATPDLPSQMKLLKQEANSEKETPDAIFLTHAHVGHYTGLMYLGKEAMNANEVSVYAMPKMKDFLETNGPWSQLVTNKNIGLLEMKNKKEIQLSKNYKVTPFTVPHRDEYSETVGYTIQGPERSALFIPDIDKWAKWETSIIEAISKVDYAFIDATFFDAVEVNNRDIAEIPHPFIVESMELFEDLSPKDKNKVYFIHFNHTNPVIDPDSLQAKQVIKKGFNIAKIYDRFQL
jgi:pyrroloquinoline quinone biosynthesis protein B